MQVSSTDKLPDYQIIGNKLRIHWNHEQVTKHVDGETQTYWQCDEAVCAVTSSRDQIIEAVIRTQYPNYGAEIAAVQNGGEDNEKHQQMRALAKQLADEYLSQS